MKWLFSIVMLVLFPFHFLVTQWKSEPDNALQPLVPYFHTYFEAVNVPDLINKNWFHSSADAIVSSPSIKNTAAEIAFEKELQDLELSKNRAMNIAITLLILSIFGGLIAIYQWQQRRKIFILQQIIQSDKEAIEYQLELEREKAEQLLLRIKNFEKEKEVHSKEVEISKLLFTSGKLNSYKEKVETIIDQTELENTEKKRLKKQLALNKGSNVDWSELTKQFNASYPSFIKRVEVQYDKLTSNDIKLLMLLRLNLSTKEIAALLNISEKSSEVAKYRLRQKLELPKGKNLTDLIHTL